MKRTFAAFALALAAIAPPAAAGVSVGDPGVSGAHLKPYTNTWKFTQQRPGETPVEAGTWTDALERTTHEGRPALKRTQVAKYSKKDIQLTFVDVFDPKTMEPFSADYSRTDNGDTRHTDFHHTSVVFRHTASKDAAPEEKAVTLAETPFDFYGLYGVLVSALPLKEGYETEIPAFDTDTMAIDRVPVKVIGKETVEAGAGKKRETWVVETTPKLYGKMTWWVSKEAPYVIKAVLEIPKKEDGSKEVAAIVTYTMV